jgi:molecular chaperone DnaK (HSP70)
MSDFTLGLDFGTTTTLVALPGLEPRVFPIGKEAGSTWLPSVMSIDQRGVSLFGEDADKGALQDQFRSPKRAITLDQPTVTNAAGLTMPADDVITRILEEVRRRCEENGLMDFSSVRVSCPAMWTGAQRRRLIGLVNDAGFVSDIDNVLDEPISASIAWWWSRFSKGLRIEVKQRAVIFDLGGGTLDVAVVDFYPRAGLPEMTIIAARGIAIAGDELDRALAEHVTQRLAEEFDFDVASKKDAEVIRVAIRLAARECKEILSAVDETTFSVDPSIADIPTLKVSRVELNDIFHPLMRSAIACVESALREARMKAGDGLTGPEVAKIPIVELASDIDYVVLAGGMSQIPKVADDLQAMMPKAQVEFATSNSRTCTSAIVLGAANRNDFENLNVHRPNFNFIIVHKDKLGQERRHLVYEAFTPLYTLEQVIVGEKYLGYRIAWLPHENSPSKRVTLRIESIGGREVTLLDGESGNKLDLEFDADTFKGVVMKIYVNGNIVIYDSSGREFVARVRKWPHIRWNSSMNLSRYELKIEVKSLLGSNYKGEDWWRFK